MRTGLTKREKTTAIFFDEYGSMIEVQTHNTDLKKRLTAFAEKHPQCCRRIDDNEQGGLTFEIEKGRLSFRVASRICRRTGRTKADTSATAENSVRTHSPPIKEKTNRL